MKLTFKLFLDWLCVIPLLVFGVLVAPNLIDSGFIGWLMCFSLGIAILLLTICLIHSIHATIPKGEIE